MPLQGTDKISIPADAVLKFTYPASGQDPLYIHSGANSINWSYVLNTQSTPTIGGEVVQVLSCFVGPITIVGQTAGIRTNQSGKYGKNEIPGWKKFNGRENFSPNHELQAIIAWFRKYMTKAGSDNLGNVYRSERAITFEYAERGWKFYIMPTGLKGFRYDKEIISPQWTITAEIVSNNALDYFAGVTMTSFTDELLTTNSKLQGQIGLSYFQTTGTQNANPNFGQTGDYGSTNPFLNPALSGGTAAALKKMGDNFQGLVAAWSSGDFAHFGFGALLDDNALPKNVDAVYQKLFGNTFLGSLPGYSGSGTSGGGSGSGTYTYKGSNPQDAAAASIANAFSARNVPPELGVAVALHESSLNPDQTQYGCNLPACGIGLFQVNGDGSGEVGSHKAQIVAAGKQRVYGSAKGNIVGIYTQQMQADDAADFFSANKPGDISDTSNLSDDKLAEWAFAAEKGDGYLTGTSVGSCTTEFSSDISKAKAIIAGLQTTAVTSGGDVVSYAKASLQYAGQMNYTEKADRSQLFHRSKGDFKGAGADCSQFVASILHWTGNTKVSDSDYTGTLLQKGQSISSPEVGCVVVWGPGTGTHTAFITEQDGNDWWTIGFGGQSAPDKVTLTNMNAYFAAAGQPGTRFLRF